MNKPIFPDAPAKIFFVGIGGIGMSALAQFLVSVGYSVAGSDRDLTTPAQAELFKKLQKQGMAIFKQDGSGVATFQPEAMVYSTAIEESNPDFIAGKEIPRFHRSIAMAETVNRTGYKQIAVAGSCGKTSVTGWIASALTALGQNPAMINGGYTGEFRSEIFPGNFKPGKNFIVYEADESDGSLINFQPDTAVLLNLGLDHYEKDELDKFFKTYLNRARQIIISNKLTYLLPDSVKSSTFSEDPLNSSSADFSASKIVHTPTGANFTQNNNVYTTTQFGDHSIANALAVLATLRINDFSEASCQKAISAFKGVDRRFDYKGVRGNKRIYDDYAHNIKKIGACIKTAQNLSKDPVIAAFQPHGYGPLGFMKEGLCQELKEVLRPQDQFILLPVFYAGGTTSFKPTSEEVAEEFQKAGLKAISLEDRNLFTKFLDGQQTAASVVVLGARDPSLADWSQSLTTANL